MSDRPSSLDLSDQMQVDPNKLVLNSEGNALGFEKVGGFEEVTNFSLKVGGYVGDGCGNVIGYVLDIILAVVDPLDLRAENVSKYVCLSLFFLFKL